MKNNKSLRRVVAAWDADGVYVYQAFAPHIVRAAVERGTFADGFSLSRMTWIKPSFAWMLYRSGYASKENQEAVVRVRLSHAGFLTILQTAVPSSFDAALFASEADWKNALAASDVRYQWDPERTLGGARLEQRAIQLGVQGETVRRYVGEWILGVEDVTELAREAGRAASSGGTVPFPSVLEETEYPVSDAIRRTLGYD